MKALDLFGIDFNMGFIRYGAVWRRSRRELQASLRPADLESYQPLEQRAVHRLLRNLLSSPDNFEQHIRHMTGQVVVSIAYGIDAQPENDPYVEGAEMMQKALSAGSTQEAALLDAIPWLTKMPSWLPGARFKRYAQEWYPIVARSAKAPYNKVKKELAAGTATPCVAVNTILKLDENSTEEDKWIASSVPGTMYMATVDTAVSALTTFILAMTLYPDVQRKAQAEIDQIVGNSRLPIFSDEGGLPYVQAVLKETLRWHPVTPLAVPHRVMENDTYEGYHIPAGATIIPNAWGMMHDPAMFPEPERFYPERWLSPDAPTYPNPAFGFGGRRCPGRFLAPREHVVDDGGNTGHVRHCTDRGRPSRANIFVRICVVCEAFPLLYPTTFEGSGFTGADDRMRHEIETLLGRCRKFGCERNDLYR